MKTLLITNSFDETSDFLLGDFAPGQVFRLNYDLIKDYEIFFNNEYYKIETPFLSIEKHEVAKVLWRKAFLGSEHFDLELTKFHAAEYKYILREIMNIAIKEGKFVLNFPDADQFQGKIYQNMVAKKYFKVPETNFISSQRSIEVLDKKIAKSLSSKNFSDGKVLYTTDISGKTLRPQNPFYIQEKISAELDVTVVYVYGKIFSYCLDRKLFNGLDWRSNPFELAKFWKEYHLSKDKLELIESLMSELNWCYGRLDFLLSGDDLIFLEVNPNGQWGWLDSNKINGLFAAIRDAIDPQLPIPISRLT